ncbi:MAG: diguanylate cyclase [Nitrospinae bacterium]|nr:diguanylate cyclase [Nitrospinota bacterium]
MGLSILIIDDSKAIRDTVKEYLQKTSLFENYLEASNGLEGFKIMLKQNIDLVICDIVMPGISGFQFLALKGSKPEFQEIQVIMLTAEGSVDQKVKGLEQGASDYVIKPFDPAELIARVKVQLKIRSLQESLRELSITDGLTKTYNRRYLIELMKKEFYRAKRNKSSLSFILLDIDHFKSINDTYGHQQGDSILADLVPILEKGIRRHEYVARYGGEEFALLLPETDLKGAMIVGEKIRREVQGFKFTGQNEPLNITISLGVATFHDNNIETVDHLIKAADDALYRAKRNGRNRVESVDPEDRIFGIGGEG